MPFRNRMVIWMDIMALSNGIKLLDIQRDADAEKDAKTCS